MCICAVWCMCIHVYELPVFRYWLWCWPGASAASPRCLYWQTSESRDGSEVWRPWHTGDTLLRTDTNKCNTAQAHLPWKRMETELTLACTRNRTAHTNTFDSPSNSLQLRSSPFALHHQPFGGIYLPMHPSIHLAIDFDQLTSDPSDLCPMTAMPLLKATPPPPHTHTYVINIHPPHTFIYCILYQVLYTVSERLLQGVGSHVWLPWIWGRGLLCGSLLMTHKYLRLITAGWCICRCICTHTAHRTFTKWVAAWR